MGRKPKTPMPVHLKVSELAFKPCEWDGCTDSHAVKRFWNGMYLCSKHAKISFARYMATLFAIVCLFAFAGLSGVIFQPLFDKYDKQAKDTPPVETYNVRTHPEIPNCRLYYYSYEANGKIFTCTAMSLANARKQRNSWLKNNEHDNDDWND